jgi:hypothetical protein
MYVLITGLRVAAVRDAPEPRPPVTLTPSVTAVAVAVKVEARVMLPLTLTVPEPREARTVGFVLFSTTSAVAWAAAPAVIMPAASALEAASGFAVEIAVTVKLVAPEVVPAPVIFPSMWARVDVRSRA